MLPPPPKYTLFPYTTLFRSDGERTPRHPPRMRVRMRMRRRFLARGRTLQQADGWRPHLRHRMRVGMCMQRSEEHTSELQSRFDLVCRLRLEKKNVMNMLPQT